MKRIALTIFAAVLATASSMFADTGSTTMSVVVAPEAAITVTTGTSSLTHSGNNFASYTATTSYTFRIRTTTAGGTGTVAAKLTTDFVGTGAPVGTDLTFGCTTAGVGTICTGTANALAATDTTALAFAADIHSADEGDSASLTWTLPNKTTYKTGTYTALVTLTISAT